MRYTLFLSSYGTRFYLENINNERIFSFKQSAWKMSSFEVDIPLLGAVYLQRNTWKTTASIIKDGKTLGKLSTKWSGACVINWDGKSFNLHTRGFFNHRYVLTEVDGLLVYTFKPSYTWTGTRYAVEPDFNNRLTDVEKEGILFLASLHLNYMATMGC